MDDRILIYYSPFSAESQIWLVKDGKTSCGHVSSNLEDLSANIIGLTYAENVYNVAVSAPYAMTTEIINAVKEKEQSTYSTNKINIEGI